VPERGADQSEWVVFDHSFAAILERVPAGTLTTEVKAQLKAGGIDPDRRLLPAYPYPVWVQVTEILAKAVHPGADPATAHRRLGHLFLEGYARTTLGIAVMALLKLIGPRRALGRTAKAFRSGNNYFESKLDETGPNAFHLWINETGTHPEFIAGVLQSALSLCGADQPQVEPIESVGPGRSYKIGWSASAPAPRA
jgi:uncharacterized protein (TIGR02265 family)